jgi:DNA helicase-4
MPRAYDSSRIIVEFHTVHASKGLEADHVIIPRMTSETLGFPSRIADDPVLRLAMPSGDTFEFAEERRLFYVALTRSRGGVTLLTLEGKESSFIAELVKDQKLEVRNLEGETESLEACACGKGVMTPKRGPYGRFLGCSTHPKCRITKKIAVTQP